MKDLNITEVVGGLYDFLDALDDLCHEYDIGAIKKCDGGVMLINNEDDVIIFDNYDNGTYSKLKVIRTAYDYGRYGDPSEPYPRPRLLSKNKEELEKNISILEAYGAEKGYWGFGRE